MGAFGPHRARAGEAGARTRERRTRVLTFCHDSFGLGHLRRTTTLARSFVEADLGASVLCVTGSPRPDLFELPHGIDFVRLPGVTKGDQGEYVPRRLSVSTPEVVSLRAAMIKAVAHEFRPDVIVVDHSPIGIGGELLPMLEEQRRVGNALIVLGMRDIVDEPLRARRELAREHTRQALETLYDRIIVYGHPHVCDVALEYGLGARVGHKLRYVGVACATDPESRPAEPTAPAPAATGGLLVTVGGGEDGHPTLQAVVDWLECDQESAQAATLVTGPMMGAAERDGLARRAERVGARVLESTSDLPALLEASDTVIGMGGYNTVYESLAMRKRVVVIPRVYPRREQWERARRLKELNLLDYVDPAELSRPRTIASAVERARARTPIDPADVGIRFDGARVAAESLLSEAHARALPLAS
ncbi:MAG: glycosyltransferase [Gemmatimonadota bacterium]